MQGNELKKIMYFQQGHKTESAITTPAWSTILE